MAFGAASVSGGRFSASSAASSAGVSAMARVGVTGLDPDQPASTLEAGARQSLAIARALHPEAFKE